jgi:hypothetical protein
MNNSYEVEVQAREANSAEYEEFVNAVRLDAEEDNKTAQNFMRIFGMNEEEAFEAVARQNERIWKAGIIR